MRETEKERERGREDREERKEKEKERERESTMAEVRQLHFINSLIHSANYFSYVASQPTHSSIFFMKASLEGCKL